MSPRTIILVTLSLLTSSLLAGCSRCDGETCPTTCEHAGDACVDAVDAAGDSSDARIDSPMDVPVDVTADASMDVPGDRGPTCAANEMVCAGACTPVATDPANCGACEHACPSIAHGEAACIAGTCGATCESGYHLCNGTCADDSAAESCGSACMPCTPPAGASPTCTAGACGFVCNGGFDLIGGACEARVPRQIAPLSGARVTSRQPTLRWQLAADTDGATVTLCRDRAMTTACVSFDATGPSGSPTSPLDPGVWFWSARGRVGSVAGTRATAVWEIVVGARSAAHDTSYGGIVDVNGDGYADVVSGPNVYFGGATGVAAPPSQVLNIAGWGADGSIAAGDFNGDGYTDLAIGCPTANTTVGLVYVFHGSPTGPAIAATRTMVGLDGVRGQFGASVTASDANGDGYADLVVGAPGANSYAGRVYVHAGGAAGVMSQAAGMLDGAPSTSFGRVVIAVGDLNNDGFGDVALAGSGVEIHHGHAAGLASGAAQTLTVTGETNFGYSLAVADVDGDGWVDLVAGSPQAASGAGRVYVYTGNGAGLAEPSTPIVGTGPGFGSSVGHPGDVTGDGIDDVTVARDPGSAGVLVVYAGRLSGLDSVPVRALGAPAGNEFAFGFYLPPAGDINGDGLADLLVGAKITSTSNANLHVYYPTLASIPTTPAATFPLQ